MGLLKHRIETTSRNVEILFSAEKPRLMLLGDVLSAGECHRLIERGEAAFKRSTVVDNEGGGDKLMDIRTSQDMFLPVGHVDTLSIEDRLAEICGVPVEHGESMQILKYQPGEQYEAHYDWFDPTLPGQAKHLERGGQRTCTFLLYLNDGFEGGGTHFPNMGLTVHPKAGSAVLFWNVREDGVPDVMAMHAGLPVVKGVKYVASKWIHERAFV